MTSRPGRTTRARADRHRLALVGNVLPAEVERLVLDEDDRVRVGDRRSRAARRRRRPCSASPPSDRARASSQASRLCECCAPPRWPAPPCVRSTSGTVSWPPDMKCAFAAWLTSWSRASVTKSTNMISTTGPQPGLRRADRDPADRRLADRRVADALGAELLGEPGGRAPRPALGDVLAEHEHALVGAHRLRERLRDRLRGRSSRSRRVHELVDRAAARRERARARELDRLVDLGAAPPRLEPPRRAEPALQAQDRVELLPLLGGERLAVVLRVALVVAAQPVGQALEQERPFSRPRLREEPAKASRTAPTSLPSTVSARARTARRRR